MCIQIKKTHNLTLCFVFLDINFIYQDRIEFLMIYLPRGHNL